MTLPPISILFGSADELQQRCYEQVAEQLGHLDLGPVTCRAGGLEQATEHGFSLVHFDAALESALGSLRADQDSALIRRLMPIMTPRQSIVPLLTGLPMAGVIEERGLKAWCWHARTTSWSGLVGQAAVVARIGESTIQFSGSVAYAMADGGGTPLPLLVMRYLTAYWAGEVT